MKNKTLIIFAIVLMIGFFGAVQKIDVVFAQGQKTEPVAQVSIQELQAIIEQLKNQIKQLQDEITKLKSEVTTVKEEIKITKELYKGISGDEVKEVQKFLKQYKEIYPEGLVTGYYGPLTEKAVRKFQERDGLPVTGKIDEITKKSINEYLVEGEKRVTICHVASENSSNKQTIEISKSALETHLTHGDSLGACAIVSAPTKPPETTTLSPEVKSIPPDNLKSVSEIVGGPIIQIAGGAAGTENLCVLTKDGVVFCKEKRKSGYVVLPIPTLTNVASIAMAGDNLCAVKKDGSAFCLGSNGYGQLGDGTFVAKTEPVQVYGLGPGTTASISMGRDFVCALKTDGSVVCWGSNDSSLDGGQIGDGTTEVVRPKPTQVVGLGPGSVSSIYSDNKGSCAIKTDNSIVCWGSVHANGYAGATKPVKISVNPGKVKTLMTRFKMTCALKADDSVVCWGQNYCGQLGNGTKTGGGTPTQVVGLGPGSTAAISSEFGRYSSALKKDGSVVSWGCSAPGDGTIFNKYSPIHVTGLGAGSTASIADRAACAVKTDGSVVCWDGGLPTAVTGSK